MKTTTSVCIAVTAISVATPAIAQVGKGDFRSKAAEARDHYISATKNLDGGKFKLALADFKAADAIVGKPITRMGVAQALEKLGRLVEAREVARSVKEIPAPPDEHPTLVKSRADAAAFVKVLDARIAYIDFEVSPSEVDAQLTVDGQSMVGAEVYGVAIDPGKHVIRASAKGYQSQAQEVAIVEGEKRRINIVLKRLPPPKKKLAQPSEVAPEPEIFSGLVIGPVTWAGIGVAGAGLIVGAAAGGAAISRTTELKPNCTVGDDGRDCPPEFYGARNEALTMAHISTACFALAGVGAGVGLVGLFVVDRPDDVDVVIRPLIGPGFAGVKGEF